MKHIPQTLLVEGSPSPTLAPFVSFSAGESEMVEASTLSGASGPKGTGGSSGPYGTGGGSGPKGTEEVRERSVA
jgi:hypothetical protein